MSADRIIGTVPTWNFGRNASFGLAVSPRKDSKLYVKLYKGVIFSRKITFLWKDLNADKAAEEGDTGSGTETGTEPEKEKIELEFKQKIEPKLVVVPTSAALIPYSEFPVVIFAGEEGVVYSRDDMGSFKSFETIEDGEIYSRNDGAAGTAYDLPELDEEEYSSEEGSTEDTKVGLLVPLLRISVEKDSDGVVGVTEVLNIVQNEVFSIKEAEADEEEDPNPEDDPCDRDGEDGADGRSTVGESGMPDSEEGAEDPEEGDSVEPCPTEEYDD